jgi:nitrogen regulatory protein PII
MNSVKRLEIVVDAGHLHAVLEMLEEAGASGYTVLTGVSGAGDRGLRPDDELSGVQSNRYILCACESSVLEAVRPPLNALLERIGGLCLVSDALSLRS